MPRMVLLDQELLPVGVSTPACTSRRATLPKVAPCSRYQANIWRTIAASYSSTRKPAGSRGLSGTAAALQFFEEQYLMDVLARQPVRGGDQDHLELGHRRRV